MRRALWFEAVVAVALVAVAAAGSRIAVAVAAAKRLRCSSGWRSPGSHYHYPPVATDSLYKGISSFTAFHIFEETL